MTAKKLKDLLSYARIKPAVNQIEIHPYWRNETTVNFCKENVRFTFCFNPSLMRSGALVYMSFQACSRGLSQAHKSALR